MTTPTPPTTPTRRIRLRRALAEEWAFTNPILGEGEPGFDRTNNMLKIGDGLTPWLQLDYLAPPTSGVPITGNAAFDAAMTAHVRSATPHPVYDDGPSLVLLYLNAKV